MKVSCLWPTGLFAVLLFLLPGGTARADFPVHALAGVSPAVYYGASRPLEKGFDGKTAVIFIHGWGGGVDTGKIPCDLQDALDDALVIHPMFPRAEILDKYGVARDGRAVWNDSWVATNLSKPGRPDDDWRGGGDAVGSRLSSFDVIDTLLARLSDRRLFPNLRKVVLTGFSAGGQFVGRYVAVGKGRVGSRIKMVYVAMAPSTYLLPDDATIWHYGLKGRPRYSRDLTRDQIMKNLRTRPCLHGCGSADVLDAALDMTPSAMSQGRNRYLRFLNFQEVVKADRRWKKMATFHTFEGIGHQAAKAYRDPFYLQYISK